MHNKVTTNYPYVLILRSHLRRIENSRDESRRLIGDYGIEAKQKRNFHFLFAIYSSASIVFPIPILLHAKRVERMKLFFLHLSNAKKDELERGEKVSCGKICSILAAAHITSTYVERNVLTLL